MIVTLIRSLSSTVTPIRSPLCDRYTDQVIIIYSYTNQVTIVLSLHRSGHYHLQLSLSDRSTYPVWSLLLCVSGRCKAADDAARGLHRIGRRCAGFFFLIQSSIPPLMQSCEGCVCRHCAGKCTRSYWLVKRCEKRLFLVKLNLPPKLINVIRCQCIWQDQAIAQLKSEEHSS